MRKEKKIYRTEYSTFYFTNDFDISYEICGYFDNRPRIIIALIFFRLTLILPFRNKWTDECDSPKWGIAIHNNTLWIYKGGKGNMNGGTKWWTWSIPFVTWSWQRTSILMKGNIWEHELSKGPKKDFYKSEYRSRAESWSYEFTDKYDGSIIPTIIHVEEREWRPKWLTWTNLFAKVRKTIEVEFSKEVGRKKGSWKGGAVGCSYELLHGETPLQCIQRMEMERTF